MDDIKLVIPPISFLGYPLINSPLLLSLLKENSFKASINEANILFLKYFLRHNKKILNDIIDTISIPLEKRIKFNLIVAKLLDVEKNFFPFFLFIQSKEFTEKWIDNFIKTPSPIIYFNFHHFRTSNKSFPWINNVIKEIKSVYPNTLAIVGGSYFIFFRNEEIEYFFKKYRYIDCLVLGEEEYVLPKIVSAFNGKLDSLKSIDGLALNVKLKPYVINTNPFIKNLNYLPIPDYSKIQLNRYLNFRVGTRILPIESSRSCPGRCIFCIEKKIGFKFRIKNPEKVVDEMEYLNKKYKIKIFRFNDCLINYSFKNLNKICDLILERDLNVFWGGMAKINNFWTKDIMEKLKKAGCRFLWFGIESASPRVLRVMKKDIDIKKVPEILENITNLGIFTVTFWITNNPLENEFDTKLSISFLEKNYEKFNAILLNKFRLMKGTKIYERKKNYGIKSLKTDIINPSVRYITKNYNHKKMIITWNKLKKTVQPIYRIEGFPIITEI